uniref:Uncharacterized protein n=1 Tax=Anopheles melas TaxID=34690 RepID=A0A182UG52_9DIPT
MRTDTVPHRKSVGERRPRGDLRITYQVHATHTYTPVAHEESYHHRILRRRHQWPRQESDLQFDDRNEILQVRRRGRAVSSSSQRQGSSHHHRNGGVTAEDHLITIGPAVLPLKPSHHHPNGGDTAADHLITIGPAVLPLKPSHHHPNGGVTAADHLITIGPA